MEREKNNKREREEGEDNEKMKKKEPSENSSKRQHLGSHKLENVRNTSRDGEEEKKKKDDYLALGVFDFPWRKESMISKSEEEWCFEDSIFFSLSNYTTCTTTGHVETEYPDQCLCENADTFIESIDFPSDKFEETEWSSGKEGVLSHPFS